MQAKPRFLRKCVVYNREQCLSYMIRMVIELRSLLLFHNYYVAGTKLVHSDMQLMPSTEVSKIMLSMIL